MPSKWQVECLLLRMESLRNEILRVKDKDRPYTETDIVYDSLVSVIDSRADRIRKAEKLYAVTKSEVPQSVFNNCAKDLEKVFAFFSYTDRVDSPRIPFELLRSLSWAANNLFDERCYTVVRLDPEYNYSILSCRREFERNKWAKYWQYAETQSADSEQKVRTPAPNVLLLGFPSPDASSTLVHALAAHEFGHEFAYKWADKLEVIRESIATKVKTFYDSLLEDYLSGLVMRREGESHDDVSEKGRKYVVVLVDRVSKNWLSEIFSDLTAARLVGPAFLAAFDRIILGHGKASERYPPASLRRSLVWDYLKMILPKVVSDPTWNDLFERNARPVSPLDEFYRVMIKVFDSVIESLVPLLEKIESPLLRFDAENLFGLVEAIEDHIDHLAPPSVVLNRVVLSPEKQLPDVEKFWLLMFAAWHYRLSPRFENLRDACGSDAEPAKAEEVLGNLVLHGLQSLELQARWEEQLAKGSAP
jgi:hypothetical protein